MKWICAMAVALAIAASATPAQAALSDCPVPPRAVNVALPSGLPPALRRALPDDIALPGEPFDATDVVVKGHKHRRYLFVWHIGSRWIVATETSGIALRAAIATYDLGQDGKTATLIDQRITFPGSVCATATRLARTVKSDRGPRSVGAAKRFPDSRRISVAQCAVRPRPGACRAGSERGHLFW